MNDVANLIKLTRWMDDWDVGRTLTISVMSDAKIAVDEAVAIKSLYNSTISFRKRTPEMKTERRAMWINRQKNGKRNENDVFCYFFLCWDEIGDDD